MCEKKNFFFVCENQYFFMCENQYPSERARLIRTYFYIDKCVCGSLLFSLLKFTSILMDIIVRMIVIHGLKRYMLNSKLLIRLVRPCLSLAVTRSLNSTRSTGPVSPLNKYMYFQLPSK